jgi:hypothetical protein
MAHRILKSIACFLFVLGKISSIGNLSFIHLASDIYTFMCSWNKFLLLAITHSTSSYFRIQEGAVRLPFALALGLGGCFSAEVLACSKSFLHR